MRVCVVGSINNDLTFVVERIPPPGATVLASTLVYAPGGKGANQAVAAARAGAQVQFVGSVGDDSAAATLLAEEILRRGDGRVRLDPWVLGRGSFPTDDEIKGNHHMGGTRMSRDEFRNFFCLLVAAGNDTTRYSLSATVHSLANNPQLQVA